MHRFLHEELWQSIRDQVDDMPLKLIVKKLLDLDHNIYWRYMAPEEYRQALRDSYASLLYDMYSEDLGL